MSRNSLVIRWQFFPSRIVSNLQLCLVIALTVLHEMTLLAQRMLGGGKVTSTGNDLMDDGAVLNISGSIAAMIYSFSFMGMPVTASTTITTSSKELVIEYRFAKRKKRAMAERRAGGGPEEGRRLETGRRGPKRLGSLPMSHPFECWCLTVLRASCTGHFISTSEIIQTR